MSEKRIGEADQPSEVGGLSTRFDRDFLDFGTDRDRSEREYDEAARTAISKGVEAWRALRIQGEFVNSFDALAEVGPAIAVFGSARLNEGTHAHEMARAVGRGVAEAGYAVITGGGPGTMHGANLGASEGNGTSVGLGIQLPFEDDFNEHVRLAVPFHYFFTRKVSFVKYSCGAVFCAGGLGTLDELFEVLTLVQTGKVSDYPVALVGTDFWRPLFDWLRTGPLECGTIDEADLERALITDDPDEAVAHVTGSDRRERG
jgi:uncharacterized protein (TIGR00730 family)